MAPQRAVAPTVDPQQDGYGSWREEAATVAEAYTMWCWAPRHERVRRFAAYVAALDREATAAATYATTLTRCGPWLGWRAAL
jgi:hypothetical protein